MTIEEFDKTHFHSDMYCLFQGQEYAIIMVDLDEKLIGIDQFNQDLIDWKRCEHIQILINRKHE